MKRKNWKTAQPSNLRQALEWSLEHARDRQNLSVERVAERMGLESHWTLYKWVQSGRIPAVYILPLEHICGINLISRWLASASGKLLIDMPTGRHCSGEDTHQLQQALLTATQAVLGFYSGATDADTALGSIQNAIESLAWHRGNVLQHSTPQLELGDHDEQAPRE